MREPEFKNMLDVLERKAPARPVLYELFLNETLYATLGGNSGTDTGGGADRRDGGNNPRSQSPVFRALGASPHFRRQGGWRGGG